MLGAFLTSSCWTEEQKPSQNPENVQQRIFKISELGIPGYQLDYQNRDQIPEMWLGMFKPLEPNPSFQEVQIQLTMEDSSATLTAKSFVQLRFDSSTIPVHEGELEGCEVFTGIDATGEDKTLKASFVLGQYMAMIWIPMARKDVHMPQEIEYLFEQSDHIMESLIRYLRGSEMPS